jgi:SAM-dependent methyltransferase
MTQNVYEPFNKDIEKFGGYQYTLPERLSSIRANRRFSDVIIQGASLDGKRVVDVGCGDGTYTQVLRIETRATYILGIDPAELAIDHAKKRGAPRYKDLEFRQCLATDLVKEGQHFDAAIFRGVIHHVGDPAVEIAVGLKLAQQVFFLEPNGWNLGLKLLERFSSYHREHRERSYRLKRYRQWIEEAGGQIDVAFYFGLVPMFSPNWLVTIASALEPLVERLPLLRVLICGQIAILASMQE